MAIKCPLNCPFIYPPTGIIREAVVAVETLFLDFDSLHFTLIMSTLAKSKPTNETIQNKDL